MLRSFRNYFVPVLDVFLPFQQPASSMHQAYRQTNRIEDVEHSDPARKKEKAPSQSIQDAIQKEVSSNRGSYTPSC